MELLRFLKFQKLCFAHTIARGSTKITDQHSSNGGTGDSTLVRAAGGKEPTLSAMLVLINNVYNGSESTFTLSVVRRVGLR